MADPTDRTSPSQPAPELLQAAWESAAQRSRPGLLAYPLLFLVAGASSGLAVAPAVWWTLALALAGLTALRTVLVLRFDTLYRASPERWQMAFRASLLAIVALLSGLVHATLTLGQASPNVYFVLTIGGAVTSVGVLVCAHDLLLSRLYVAVMGLSVILALARITTAANWPSTSLAAFAVAAYAFYLFIFARLLHDERWKALEAHHQLGAAHANLERQVAERTEALRKAGEDYRLIFENAHDPIIIFSPDDERVLQVNRRACEVYGFTREEFIGMSLVEISENAARGRRQVEETVREGVFYNFETVQLREDGSPMFLEINASTIEYEGQAAILSINRDVTERRRNEELRLAKEAAERADLAKSEFLANMSHEIRTPLAGVIGLADLLLKSGLEGRQRDYAALVQSAGESLLRLIDDILDFSKIEAGKLVLEAAPFAPRPLLREICDLLRFRAREKGIQLHLTVPDTLPVWLLGDAARLRQVLLNLIGNAVKFTSAGQVDLRVEANGSRVLFRVQDTGIGIAEEARASIFSPFQQADSSTSRRFGGTGLGLAISRRIVLQMGGDIGFESTPGRGSVFWFEVPLPATAEPAHAADAPEEMAGSVPRTRRILVAEDDPINQLVAVRQLEVFGFRVTAVSNGREALAALEESPYDLVLMDCQMPEMDGYETTRRLRVREGRAHPRLPIIALTAHALKDDLQRCLDAGMDDYVTKPFHPETLRRTVEKWLTSSDTRPADLSPSPAPGDEPRLDPGRLHGLRELGKLGGSNLLATVITRFQEQPLLTALRQDLTAGDRSALMLHAHTLKGSSGALGALRLARLCADLEKVASTDDLAACATRVEELAEEYRRVLDELAEATLSV